MARSKKFIDGLVWRLRTLGAPKVPNHALGFDLAFEFFLSRNWSFYPFIGYPNFEWMWIVILNQVLEFELPSPDPAII